MVKVKTGRRMGKNWAGAGSASKKIGKKKAESRRSPVQKKGENPLFGIAQIAGVIAISALVWVLSGQIASALGPYSYIGAFLISLIASASIFVPTAPLQLAIIAMASSLNPIVLGIAAGFGSGIGEFSGFMLGQGSSQLIRSKDRNVRWLMAFQKKVLSYHPGIGIFVLALIPNPIFDFAGIFAGLAGMKPHRFLYYCIAGRVLRYIILAYFGLWAHAFA